MGLVFGARCQPAARTGAPGPRLTLCLGHLTEKFSSRSEQSARQAGVSAAGGGGAGRGPGGGSAVACRVSHGGRRSACLGPLSEEENLRNHGINMMEYQPLKNQFKRQNDMGNTHDMELLEKRGYVNV